MPDDNSRLDLSADLNQAKSAFLNDMEIAAEQVKDQLKAAAENERKQAQAARSKKMSALVVAVAAILLVVIAYWVVFNKPNSDNSSQAKSQYTGAKVQIVNPAAPAQKPAAQAPPQTAPTKRSGQDSQVVEHPSDEYEQPSSGM
jgi:hypothetical protein